MGILFVFVTVLFKVETTGFSFEDLPELGFVVLTFQIFLKKSINIYPIYVTVLINFIGLYS